MIIPEEALPLLWALSPVFTQPTYQRMVVLTIGAILCPGRRTVSNILRTLGSLAFGHPTSYHRLFSQARWSALQAACVLSRLVVFHLVKKGPICLLGDDTVTEHRGKKVYGKGCHRDPVRSSHSYTAFRYGHKWVVLCVLVRFPFVKRAWALPVLAALYRSPEEDKQQGQRHRTLVQIMQVLLELILRWFPDRSFVFVGDGSYGTHEMARFAKKQGGRLILVSRFYADANLYLPPPPREGKKRGRPRVKGEKQPAPCQVVHNAPRTKLRVGWYGGEQREVEVVSESAHWFKSGQGLVQVRWVFVHDLCGKHRDEYLFCTEVTLLPKEVIEFFTSRWNIETTFEEVRAYLGLQSTRGWTQKTVMRSTPWLFALYTFVALLYWLLPQQKRGEVQVEWEGKEGITFSDAITSVRRWLWQECIFATCGHLHPFSKFPEPLQEILLYALAPAA